MVFIYEDGWENFYPLSHLRPVTEIRCGSLTFREKLDRLYSEVVPVIRKELAPVFAECNAGFEPEINTVPKGHHLFIAAGTLLAEKIELKDERLLVDEQDRVLGFTTENLKGAVDAEKVQDFLVDAELKKVQVPGKRIAYPWDIFPGLELEVTRDFAGVLRDGNVDQRAVVYGDKLRIEEGARIDAGTVLDCRKGPVTVARGSVLKGPNLIEGPCYIGPDCVVDSARLRAGTVLGPICRAGGEIEASILHGYVNKHHEGFIGHAYLGQWVNLGAMTTNSDLKNNYSEVRVVQNDQMISTGTIKFGCLIGDHTKTAIGSLIPTGAIIGIFSNILGGGLCEKNVASFSWGKGKKYELDKLFETASTVMGRRDVELGDEMIGLIQNLYDKLTDA